jgi:SMC interacting uncharacterized protein involved in chromosome segregation
MPANDPIRETTSGHRNVYDATMQAMHAGSIEARLDALGEKVDDLGRRIDKRFEQVDKRFEQVDKRFEQVDKRFEQVDKRFERLETELREQHREFSDRFDRLQKLMLQFSGGALLTVFAALVAGLGS